MGRFGAGQPIRRKEDARFLTGDGRYTDDETPRGGVHALFLRSPEAHARIVRVDGEAAREAPGVLAVYTGENWREWGLGGIPVRPPLKNRDGSDIHRPVYPALAADRVRHVGQPVAMVVAATRDAARDALELIEVDYETLPAITDPDAALAPGAAPVWDDAPGNVCLDWEVGDASATAAAIEGAAHVVELEVRNERVIPSPMEPRGAIGHFDPATGRRTLEGSVQAINAYRNDLAGIFGCEPDEVRVVARDVGGGFGCKNMTQPEHVMVLAAAERLARPVKWINDRIESFVSDVHGRGQRNRVRLGLDQDHRFVALEVDTVADLGAFPSSFGPFIPSGATAATIGGPYALPAIHMRVRGVYSHMVPTDAYRGAGRPEAAYLMERAVERAAAALGVDAIELRRRNFIADDAYPHRNGAGITIDCGAFATVLDRALALAGADGFDQRARRARERGLRRGLGVSCYLEATLGQPVDTARLAFREDGTLVLAVGTQSTGQGHETVFSQIVADRLGVEPERIEFHQGDSDETPGGGGHGGSRALHIGGNAVLQATDLVVEKARRVAAHLLEAAESDLEYDTTGDAPRFTVAGTDRAVSMAEVLDAALDPERVPPEVEPGIDETGEYQREHHTYPNGCHVAEVEVDPETGEVAVARYSVVDDFGRIINPLVVGGQIMGGVAQGIGQALLEQAVFERETGQLLSASYQDYSLPRAGDLPTFDIELYEDAPSPSNPLGIKGCGEAGCVAAPPAVVNAVANALAEYDPGELEMPLTPQRVWRLIHGDG